MAPHACNIAVYMYTGIVRLVYVCHTVLSLQITLQVVLAYDKLFIHCVHAREHITVL